MKELLIVRPALADLVELLLEVEQLLNHGVVLLRVDDDLTALALDVLAVDEAQLIDAGRSHAAQQLVEELEIT